MSQPDVPLRSSASPKSSFGLVRLAFGLVGLGFAVVAVMRTRSEIGSELGVSMPRVLLALLMIIATTMMAARAWSAVLPGPPDRTDRHIYYSAIVGKYIPGGFFQAAAQVGLASRTGLGLGPAFSSYVVSMAMAVIAGLLSGIGLAVIPEFGGVPRSVALVAVVLGLWLISGDTLHSLVDWISRVTGRSFIGDALPPRRQIWNAVFWNLGGLVAVGVSYGLVANGMSSEVSVTTAAAAFLVAWLVGFLAVPFPAGLGVREAVLVLLLSPWLSSGLIVAASLLHRLLTIVAEVLLFLVSRLRRSTA